MHRAALKLLAVNAVGGAAVLGSYWYGFATAADAGALWGGVPAWLRPAYTVSMLTAAVGYFPALAYVVCALDPDRARIGTRGYGMLVLAYALILVPSALWMPLTLRYLATPSVALWLLVRLVLFAVAAGSLVLLYALVMVRPRPGGWWRTMAVVGQVAFCVQTVLLDALVWPVCFPVVG